MGLMGLEARVGARYKQGDVVCVKSADELLEVGEMYNAFIINPRIKGSNWFSSGMLDFCGDKVTIRYVLRKHNGDIEYRIREDDGIFGWDEWMLKDFHKKRHIDISNLETSDEEIFSKLLRDLKQAKS